MTSKMFQNVLQSAEQTFSEMSPEGREAAERDLNMSPHRYKLMTNAFDAARDIFSGLTDKQDVVEVFAQIQAELPSTFNEFNAKPLALKAAVYTFCLTVSEAAFVTGLGQLGRKAATPTGSLPLSESDTMKVALAPHAMNN